MKHEHILHVIETPAIWIAQGIFGPVSSIDKFTNCTATAFNRGFYNGLILVTSGEQKISIVAARKLSGSTLSSLLHRFGIGNLKVELIVASVEAASADDVKLKLLESLSSGYWDGRDDTEELQYRVQNAKSIPELLQIVGDMYFLAIPLKR